MTAVKRPALVLLLLLLIAVSHVSLADSLSQPKPYSQHPSYATLPSRPHHFPSVLSRFAFGSCNRQDWPQPLFSAIVDSQPQLFLFLGDTIYADSHAPGLQFIRWPGSPARLRSQYALQAGREEWQRLTAAMPVLAVWDDHDYGENDGDINSPHKREAQRLFLDFLREPETDIRRQREGVYTSYTAGPQGRRVKFLLLDLRYFQSPTEDDLLGAQQWRWLEEELDYSAQASAAHCAHGEREGTEECDAEGRRIAPDLLIIGSSVQFAAHNRRLGEGWRLFPQSRYRFLSLIAKASLPHTAVLILSGDVHYGEAVRTDVCSNSSASISIHPIVDVTSSGLTHTTGRSISVPLTQRVLPLVLGKPRDRGQHLASGLGMDKVCVDLNYGLTDIDWERRQLTVQLLGLGNAACMRLEFSFAELSPRTLPLQDVPFPAWPAAGSSHPMSTSSPSVAASIERCQYEIIEQGVRHWYISGLPGLVSLAAAVVLLAAAAGCGLIALIVYALLSLLRRCRLLGSKAPVTVVKKRQ